MIAYGYYHATLKRDLNTTLLFQDVKKGFMLADDHVVKAITSLTKKKYCILALSNKLGKVWC